MSDVCLLCSSNIFLTILAAVLWLVLLGFCFIGLAIVADDYLVPSLEKITEYCDVPENVATAVFLAFGSAVPEIMTSVVSTIQGKVDASLPAILGSGCIAYAVIPPVCVLAIQPFFMSTQDRKSAKQGSDVAKFYRCDPYNDARARRGSEVSRERRASMAVELGRTVSGTVISRSASGTVTRERGKSVLAKVKPGKTLPLHLVTLPLVRDVVTYLLSLGLTVVFIDDTEMSLTESSILVALYIFYLFVLIYFKNTWEEEEHPEETSAKEPLLAPAADSGEKDAFVINNIQDETAKTSSDESAKTASDELAPADAADMMSISADTLREGLPGADNKQAPEDAAAQDEAETSAPEESSAPTEAVPEQSGEPAEGLPDDGVGEGVTSTEEGSGTGCGSGGTIDPAEIEAAVEAATYDCPCDSEEQTSVVVLALSYPFYFLFEKTIPDCSDDEYEDYFFLTFVISLAYIAGLAMVTLNLVTQFCLTLEIPASLSGMTLIALGAEIPDAIGSIALAKGGMGPSAVSNCLNSQIINLLVGLGFPYLLHSLVNLGTTKEAMQLGDEGSTQMFIGSLLAIIVLAFLAVTVGDTLCRGTQAQLTVNGGAVLLLLYVLMVGAVTYYNFEVED